MPEKKSVTFSAGAWHDRDPDEARVLKTHLGHKVSIQSVYKPFRGKGLALGNARYLDAVFLECQDCCEVLLWYQEADDVDAALISDTKHKVAKSAYDDDERGTPKEDDVVTRRGYLRN